MIQNKLILSILSIFLINISVSAQYLNFQQGMHGNEQIKAKIIDPYCLYGLPTFNDTSSYLGEIKGAVNFILLAAFTSDNFIFKQMRFEDFNILDVNLIELKDVSCPSGFAIDIGRILVPEGKNTLPVQAYIVASQNLFMTDGEAAPSLSKDSLLNLSEFDPKQHKGFIPDLVNDSNYQNYYIESIQRMILEGLAWVNIFSNGNISNVSFRLDEIFVEQFPNLAKQGFPTSLDLVDSYSITSDQITNAVVAASSVAVVATAAASGAAGGAAGGAGSGASAYSGSAAGASAKGGGAASAGGAGGGYGSGAAGAGAYSGAAGAGAGAGSGASAFSGSAAGSGAMGGGAASAGGAGAGYGAGAFGGSSGATANSYPQTYSAYNQYSQQQSSPSVNSYVNSLSFLQMNSYQSYGYPTGYPGGYSANNMQAPASNFNSAMSNYSYMYSGMYP